MLSWVVVVLMVMLMAAYLWAGMASTPNKLESPESVPIMLRYLLDRGVDGGKLIFHVRHDRRRKLVFVKYIAARNDVGFRCFFNERGLEQPFARFREELAHRGMTYSEEVVPSVGRRIVIDCGRDIGLAHLVVRLAFERALEARIKDQCVARFRRVLISNEPDLTGVDTNGG